MSTCRWWKTQADGFHGWCSHPDSQPGDVCILNSGDECVLYEEKEGEEYEAIHTCSVCGSTMSSKEYEENGCIFCGEGAEEVEEGLNCDDQQEKGLCGECMRPKAENCDLRDAGR